MNITIFGVYKINNIQITFANKRIPNEEALKQIKGFLEALFYSIKFKF